MYMYMYLVRSALLKFGYLGHVTCTYVTTDHEDASILPYILSKKLLFHAIHHTNSDHDLAIILL